MHQSKALNRVSTVTTKIATREIVETD